jgi:hypothetical protein
VSRFCSTLPSQFKESRFNDLHFAFVRLLSDHFTGFLKTISMRLVGLRVDLVKCRHSHMSAFTGSGDAVEGAFQLLECHRARDHDFTCARWPNLYGSVEHEIEPLQIKRPRSRKKPFANVNLFSEQSEALWSWAHNRFGEDPNRSGASHTSRWRGRDVVMTFNPQLFFLIERICCK